MQLDPYSSTPGLPGSTGQGICLDCGIVLSDIQEIGCDAHFKTHCFDEPVIPVSSRLVLLCSPGVLHQLSAGTVSLARSDTQGDSLGLVPNWVLLLCESHRTESGLFLGLQGAGCRLITCGSGEPLRINRPFVCLKLSFQFSVLKLYSPLRQSITTTRSMKTYLISLNQKQLFLLPNHSILLVCSTYFFCLT